MSQYTDTALGDIGYSNLHIEIPQIPQIYQYPVPSIHSNTLNHPQLLEVLSAYAYPFFSIQYLLCR